MKPIVVVISMLVFVCCSSPENPAAIYMPVDDAKLWETEEMIHKVQYRDSTIQSRTGAERAAYLLSLLDTVDRYDPIHDSIARFRAWYGRYQFDTMTFEQRMRQSVYYDPTEDQFECSDRYKLLWFTHLALTGGQPDSTTFPVVIGKGETKPCVSYDLRLICDDDTGNKFHAVKIHTSDYLALKGIYTDMVANRLPVSQIDSVLADHGYYWDFNVAPDFVVPDVDARH